MWVWGLVLRVCTVGKQTPHVHAPRLKFSTVPLCVHGIWSWRTNSPSSHVQVQIQNSLFVWVQGLVLGNKLPGFAPLGSNSALSSHIGCGIWSQKTISLRLHTLAQIQDILPGLGMELVCGKQTSRVQHQGLKSGRVATAVCVESPNVWLGSGSSYPLPRGWWGRLAL